MKALKIIIFAIIISVLSIVIFIHLENRAGLINESRPLKVISKLFSNLNKEISFHKEDTKQTSGSNNNITNTMSGKGSHKHSHGHNKANNE